MFSRIKNQLSTLSTRGAILAAFLVIVAASGIAFLLTRSGADAQADASVQPNAARIDQVDGSVAIARTNADTDNVAGQEPDWAEATVNTPVSIGDRIYARNDSHASIALTGHDSVRLNPEASLDVLALANRRTQLALRSGSAIFDVGELASDELYEVATPCGSVDFAQPGLYQVGLEGDNAVVSVLNGVARVVGVEGSGDINRGQVFTLACSTAGEAASAATSPIAPNLAGEIVDDYYRDRYAKVYDGRYRNYDAYIADPSFYDPYRSSLSCQYVSADIPGLSDLDYYGDWVNVSDYGYCWAPRVSTGWAPYRSGVWDLDDAWGPTWVASEPWGWAPYHYGRWTFVSDRWFWVPEVRTRPAYCPAPVAFFSVGEQIAWVPLGPREVYVARYYDRNFNPRYLASADVINVARRQRTFVNFNAPGAVTVVGVNGLRGPIGPGRFNTGDSNFVARSRSLLDPLSVDGVRQIASSRGDARRRIKLARAEQERFNKPVIANAKLAAAPGRQDLARAFNVQPAPEKWKDKVKINQGGEAANARGRDGLPQPALSSNQRDSQMSALATRAEQGDKSARREMRQMMREEQRTGKQTAAQSPVTGQQAQAEQSRAQIKQQRRADRQQQVTAAKQGATVQTQQQPVKQQTQIKQQRKIERQAQQSSAASQQQAARQAQQQQIKQQQKVERQQQQVRPQQQQVRPQPKPPKQRPPDVQFQQQRQAAAMQQQAARAQQAQRQAVMQQQAARAQQAQRQAVMQQQAARAQQTQQAQRQAVRPQPRQGPELLGPPIRQNQPQQRVEQPRRKPPQQ